MTNQVLELYRFAHAQGYGDEDPSAVVKLFETADSQVEIERSIDDEFSGY